MKETFRVLVVDDEKPVRNALRVGFEKSEVYDFVVVCKETPSECIDLEESHNAAFDVCVIDLGFSSESSSYLGHNLVLGLSCVRTDGIAVVYSGHPSVSNVVRAMKLGATDFLSKADDLPHQVVDRVEQLLSDLQRREDTTKRVNEFLRLRHDDLSQQYSGQVLAILADHSGAKVVAAGRSRLDALLKYAELRTDPANDWPLDPRLHIVPRKLSIKE